MFPADLKSDSASVICTGECDANCAGQNMSKATAFNFTTVLCTCLFLTTLAFHAHASTITIPKTSEAHTAGSDLAIGEIVRYRLSVDIAEGAHIDYRLRDTLPAGLLFVNDGTTKVSFTVTAGMTLEATMTGADNSAVPPDFTLPGASGINRCKVL